MNNNEIKKFTLLLATCEKEEEVIKILKDYNLWDDHSWRCYGDNENNYSIIGAQQATPDAALVEKIINSIDATLIAEAMSRGIDTKSKQAPQSMTEALMNFYNIKEGKLSNLDQMKRGKLANEILLVATGKKTSPNYTIIDRGEGQTPNSIPNTILSLSKSNKLRIPFVQGKFNMGGAGVLLFSGEHNFQIIITKKRKDIPKTFLCLEDEEGNKVKDDSSDYWAVTIVRREDPKDGRRSSVYRYLAPGGKVLRFKSKDLKLKPSIQTEESIPYNESMEDGTFIKVFNYSIPGFNSHIKTNLHDRLALLMPGLALPIRLVECRYTGQAHTVLSGLSVRLEENKRNTIEDGFPIAIPFKMNGQNINGLIYAFKEGKEITYKKSEGIVFAMNGQTHGSIPDSFFTRKSVGLGYISKSLLVILDCSTMDGRSRELLFMNSRDRLREGDLKSKIEKVLEERLSENKFLLKLRNERRKKAIESKLENSKPLMETIEKIITKSPVLTKMLIQGKRLSDPFSKEGNASGKGNGENPFKGRDFPTYFELKNNKKNKIKQVELDRKAKIKFETDAQNDYLYRDNLPGRYNVYENNTIIPECYLEIIEGEGTLTLPFPKEKYNIGDELNYEIEIDDDQRYEPLKESFFIKITDKTEGNSEIDGDRNGKNKLPKGRNGSNLNLPNIIPIKKEEWGQYSFTKESALTIKDNGKSGYDYFYNMDNVHLQTELKTAKNEETEFLTKMYETALVLIGMSIVNHYENITEKEKETDITEILSQVTMSVSPILIPMVRNLSELKEEE